jgi:DNA-binding transcriptional LysR family regulator
MVSAAVIDRRRVIAANGRERRLSMQQMLCEIVCQISMDDLRRLRAFHAVAVHRSFSAAGLELGYAQSVVSHHVAALEREFGLTLINRGTRPVSVTDAGARLLEHAEIVLGQVSAAQDDLRAIAGLQSGTLKVGAFLSVCNTFLPAAMARFERSHPGVELGLEQLEEPAALRKLRSGDLDVAVVWRIADAPGAPGFDEVHLADDPYWVVLPARHRLARRREVPLAELAGERFIAPPADEHAVPYRVMLEELWSQAGIAPRTHEVQDVTVARAMIAAGLSVGLLSELTLSEQRPDIAARPVRGADPHRRVYATWLHGRRVPAVDHLVRYLAEAAQARLASVRR